MTSSLISEKELLATVVEIAQAKGWLVHHVLETRHPAKRIGPGFPDLVMVHPEWARVIFAELKSQRGVPTDLQWEWLSSLWFSKGWCHSVIEVYLWRPVDLDEIPLILSEDWMGSVCNCENALLAWKEASKGRAG